MSETCNVSILIGKIVTSVIKNGTESIKFICNDGSEYLMSHFQDCCEQVVIEDINGDLEDLVGSEILQASEETQDIGLNREHDESGTWTFYKFATMKGAVTIRWAGTSNGYYSESVDFEIIKRPKLQDLMA